MRLRSYISASFLLVVVAVLCVIAVVITPPRHLRTSISRHGIVRGIALVTIFSNLDGERETKGAKSSVDGGEDSKVTIDGFTNDNLDEKRARETKKATSSVDAREDGKVITDGFPTSNLDGERERKSDKINSSVDGREDGPLSGLDGAEISWDGSDYSDNVTVNNAVRTSHEYERDGPPLNLLNEQSLDSVDYLRQRLVYVTAFSDNHFKEALGMFWSVKRCIKNINFIVFDLGLSRRNRQFLMIQKHFVIDLRRFPFSHYTHLPHVLNLFSYAWKPIMVQLLAKNYDVIIYLDSSMRMKLCDINPSLQQLLKFPLFNLKPFINSHFIEFVHDGMLKYLQYPKHRQDVGHINVHLRAGCWMLWVNDTIREKLIKPWVDCALHRECIAPHGATPGPCTDTSVHDGRYIGCHRYDQAALNVIIAREFGMDASSMAINLSISNSTWEITHV